MQPRSFELPAIPVIDLRGGGPAGRAVAARERALSLRNECLTFLPSAARAMLPVCDRITEKWLRRSDSPYIDEAASIAKELGVSGVWFLNGCYQWGCTTLAREEEGAPWLARTLDWPFPGL